MQCPQCKSEVKEGARFCWRCGATMPSAGAPAPAAPAPLPKAQPAQRGNPWILAFAAVAVMVLILGFLLLRSQILGGKLLTRGGERAPAANSLAAGTANVPIAATPPLTASPGNDVLGPPLVAAEPGNLPTASGLPTGVPGDPSAYRDDVAAYLRKLEAIQRRDAQNPMAQLIALMGGGLAASTQGLRALEDIDAPAPKEAPDYSRVFAQIAARKQAILRDFRSITPVPLPCQMLHRTYGAYLATTLKAITELQGSIGSATASPAAPLAALPMGTAAEGAKAAADAQEDLVRRVYRVPKNPLGILP